MRLELIAAGAAAAAALGIGALMLGGAEEESREDGIPAPPPERAVEPRYELILDGSATGTEASFDHWLQAGEGSFELRPNGSVRSVGGLGMLWYPVTAYGDFSLRLEYRDARKGGGHSNGGVFVRFPDPRQPLEDRPECGRTGPAADEGPQGQAWVAIHCGHEIQVYDSPDGEGDPQKTGSIYNFADLDADQAKVAERPTGDWHELEVRVVGQRYTVRVDGAVLNRFDNAIPLRAAREGDPSTAERQLEEGHIGLQNHGEDDAIEYRDVRIRRLPG